MWTGFLFVHFEIDCQLTTLQKVAYFRELGASFRAIPTVSNEYSCNFLISVKCYDADSFYRKTPKRSKAA